MKKLSSLSDKELIHLFNNGNEDCFRVLYSRYQQNIYNLALYYVRDRTLAEDLAQEATIKIFTSLKTKFYSKDGRFLSWALRIVHNHCMDYLRKPQRTFYVTDFSNMAFANVATPCPETKLIKKQTTAQLNYFINRLPEEQKQVVQYRHFEDMSFKEIAQRTNTSVNTSLGRMRYALMHLRNMTKNNVAIGKI